MCVVLSTQALLSYHEKRPSEMKRLLLAAEVYSSVVTDYVTVFLETFC